MPEDHDLVLIQARTLASNIATPMFVVDPKGTLVYYNEPAEDILGQEYAETGALTRDEWGTMWKPEDPTTGEPIPAESLPLTVALTEGRPAHMLMRITGLDGIQRHIAVTALPLFASAEEFVGALATFWEEPEDG